MKSDVIFGIYLLAFNLLASETNYCKFVSLLVGIYGVINAWKHITRQQYDKYWYQFFLHPSCLFLLLQCSPLNAWTNSIFIGRSCEGVIRRLNLLHSCIMIAKMSTVLALCWTCIICYLAFHMANLMKMFNLYSLSKSNFKAPFFSSRDKQT